MRFFYCKNVFLKSYIEEEINMKNYNHYRRGYYTAPAGYTDWVKKEYIDHAPAWCSVDLRDGNQALVVPMSLDEKLEFYKELIRIGFKEIEIGFPAASDTEYEFCRRLIEDNLIPDDVTIQVLTQAREHIIRKTFDAVRGASPENVIVHVYNSTSVAQREQVFKKSKDEIKKIATDGAALLKHLADEDGAKYKFEYTHYHPPVINDGNITDLIELSAGEIIGKQNVLRMERPTMAGEDFSFYQTFVPASFFWIGTGDKEMGTDNPLHSPDFKVDENMIHKGSAILAQCALNFLK